MNLNEQSLFTELSKFKNPDYKKIEAFLSVSATSQLLGELFFNRIPAIAYGVLKNGNLLGKTGREFRNSLSTAFEYNKIKNQSYFRCIEYLNVILRKQHSHFIVIIHNFFAFVKLLIYRKCTAQIFAERCKTFLFIFLS